MAAVERAGVELHHLLPTGARRDPSATADSVEAGTSAGSASSAQATSFADEGRTREPAMEISVVLATAEVIKLDVDAQATANDILDAAIDKLHLYRIEARRMLGLWLVSRSLSLLLKPRHAPYQIARKWSEMLGKFTSSTRAEEPLLMLKRNVFASRDEDLNVKDVGVLELLAAEARVCVLSGDWPCVDEQVALQIAGDLAYIQFRQFDESIHTVDHYRKHVVELLPAKVVHRSADKQQLYLNIMMAHDSASEAVQQLCRADRNAGSGYSSGLPDDNEVAGAYRLFLTHCCDLPCYGSVFFNAYVERAQKSLLKGKHQQVVIGINTSGVYILDTEKREPLFGGLLLDLTWELVDVCTCAQPGSSTCPHSNSHLLRDKAMPCVLLQQREPHAVDAGASSKADGRDTAAEDNSAVGGDSTVRVLAVYTKSAKLIDALLGNVMELLTAAVPPTPTPSVTSAGDASVDVVDGPPNAGGSSDAAAQSSSPFVWQERLRHSTYGCCKYNRVRTQRFSATGECLDTATKK